MIKIKYIYKRNKKLILHFNNFVGLSYTLDTTFKMESKYFLYPLFSHLHFCLVWLEVLDVRYSIGKLPSHLS